MQTGCFIHRWRILSSYQGPRLRNNVVSANHVCWLTPIDFWKYSLSYDALNQPSPFIELPMRRLFMRRRHTDWKCKGNRNVTREPERGGGSRTALPDCRNEKSSLIIRFSFSWLSLFSNRYFVFFCSEGDWRFFSVSSCKVANLKMHFKMLKSFFFPTKYGHTKEKYLAINR